ncbi:hypothetical protein ABIF64_000978 [Bradyrhizobium japonicum]|jgi:hypothetical protein
MASRALCHLRLQESDGTAKVILAPAAEKCVYRFRGLLGLSQINQDVAYLIVACARPAS